MICDNNVDYIDKIINIVLNLTHLFVLIIGGAISWIVQHFINKKSNATAEAERIKNEKEAAIIDIENDLTNQIQDCCDTKDIQFIAFKANLLKKKVERFCECFQINIGHVNSELIDVYITATDGRYDKALLQTQSIILKDKLRSLAKKAV